MFREGGSIEGKEERRGGRKITTWLKEGNGIVNSSMGLWQRFPLTCFYRYRRLHSLGCIILIVGMHVVSRIAFIILKKKKK